MIETLSRLISTHGLPYYLRYDNGPEFISGALLDWASKSKIDIAFIEPGKPWQNGLNESFNGKHSAMNVYLRNGLEIDWRQK